MSSVRDSSNCLKLGFGSLRLPVVGGDNAKIDFDELCSMVDAYLSGGGRYFEAAWAYHKGTVEMALRCALVERHPRSSFELADKLPLWMVASERDVVEVFKKQLKRCGVDYFDCYLLHNVGRASCRKAERVNAFDFLAKVKKEGLARKVGFSFHDKADVLEDILEVHGNVVDIVQLQINYLDWDSPVIQSRMCYEIARRYGKRILVMEPLKGGMLATLDKRALDILGSIGISDQIAAAFSFAATLEGVDCVLSGMSNLAQIKSNVLIFSDLVRMDDRARSALAEVASYLASKGSIPCTNCGYCLDKCPRHIPIPELFCLYNADNEGHVGGMYARLCEGKGRAGDCIKCGACKTVCSQLLDIPVLLEALSVEYEKTDRRENVKKVLSRLGWLDVLRRIRRVFTKC